MKQDTGQKTLRVVIVVLAVLLIVSGTLLGMALGRRNAAQSSQAAPAVIPDNVISSEPTAAVSTVQLSTLSHCTTQPVAQIVPLNNLVDTASGETVTLKLYRGHTEDTTPFQVKNMFPGDEESRAYALEVSYRGSVTVGFHADIRSGYEKLAEVLKCRISIDGTPVYDGLMRDMPQSVSHTLPNSQGTTETLLYDISVYLETSVGNDYMSQQLCADFRWWVMEDEGDSPTVPPEPDRPTDPSQPADPTNPAEPGTDTPSTEPTQPGEVISPSTGDTMHICIWLWIAMASLLLNIILLMSSLRRKDKKREETP